jgi:hypothetical protein
MVDDHYSTRIDFDLTAELARRLDDIIQRGIVGSKPEATRQALIEYFNKLDEQQLRRAGLSFWKKRRPCLNVRRDSVGRQDQYRVDQREVALPEAVRMLPLPSDVGSFGSGFLDGSIQAEARRIL